MIRNNQKHLNKLHIVMDALIIALAYASAWGIKFGFDSLNNTPGGVGVSPMYLYALLCVVPAYLILYAVFKLYTPKRMHGQKYEMTNILKANTVGIMIFFFVLFLTKLTDFSRAVLFIFYALNIIYEFIARILLRMLLRNIRRRGFNQKHIVLVGYSRAAEAYIDRIKLFPQWGYNIVGILDDNVDIDTKYRGERVIGRISQIEDVIAANDLDEIVITLGIEEYMKLEKIVAICEKSGVHTKFIPDYNNIIPTRPYIEDVQGLPVINIRHVPLSSLYNRFIKRTMDIVVGALALVVFSPFMLFAVIGVKISSKGPVIYKQKRIGLHNKEFEMYKFRSMEVQTDGGDERKWTTCNDPRVTKFGKFIRKTSIDELPQIINVLKGDMSLVGPRPERSFYVDKFKEEIPRYMIKHQVRPGITGWAQVNGYRGDTSIRKRIECDLYYIENWSFGFDIKILFMTVFKGFINKNAY
ncbi:MAG: undecaprenyl-phosphate glucose phosphotransferase [Butyrivibrio sp.]